jgi:hypothetical protein
MLFEDELINQILDMFFIIEFLETLLHIYKKFEELGEIENHLKQHCYLVEQMLM